VRSEHDSERETKYAGSTVPTLDGGHLSAGVGVEVGGVEAWWVWVRRRDGRHPRCFVGPDQQDGTGGVVDDEAGRWAKAGRAEARAVAVAGDYQEVGGLGGLDDFAFWAAAGRLEVGLAAELGLGGGEQVVGGLTGGGADPFGTANSCDVGGPIARSAAPA